MSSFDGDEDDLRYFLKLADGIAEETTLQWSSALDLIGRAHRVFRNLVKTEPISAPPVPLVLALQGHASLLGAVRGAVAGHIASVYPGLRVCVESALYALLMVKKPELVDVWIRRHESEEARRACRAAFSYGNCLTNLKECDADFALHIDYAYSASIDLGAHPNMRAVFPHISLNEVDDRRTEMSLAFLHSSDGFETRRALLACFETAVAVLSLLWIAFPEQLEAQCDEINALISSQPTMMAYLKVNDTPPSE
ncbi:MAG TPA: hypothetical protein VNM24_06965 [Burkholderiales bacterium]|nr:hypothetical protein [Burkholderiales bacterium]